MTSNEAIDCLNGTKLYLKAEHIDTKAIDMAIEALQDRPQGEWIDSKTAKGYVVCSNCNKLTTNINRKKYNYCPFCGAEICKGGDDE